MQADIPDPLSMPVGALMRPAARVAPEDSLALASARLRESGVGLIAVVEGDRLIGCLTERGILLSVAEGLDLTNACGTIKTDAAVVHPYDRGAQALRLLDGTHLPALVVVDDQDRVMGVLAPTDLVARRRPMLRPPMVGGMATPFGVYLTTGTVHAGAAGLALMTTGMVLFTLLFGSQFAGFTLADWLDSRHAPVWSQNLSANAFPLVLFLLLMRVIPLSGTHGAEHQVVHAIEREEELVPSIVRRMPRVHPRCGTNLAAGLTMFLGIAGSSIVSSFELRTLIAILVTVATWRPLGSALQQYVTTKPANDKQLAGGIRAGQQLLERYQSTRVAVPNIPMRIWNSGMLHVISGSLIMYGLLAAISAIFHIDLGLS